jgi:hypothetical protein
MKNVIILFAILLFVSCQKESIVEPTVDMTTKTGQLTVNWIDGSRSLTIPAMYFTEITVNAKGELRYTPNKNCTVSVNYCLIAGFNNVKSFHLTDVNKVKCQ